MNKINLTENDIRNIVENAVRVYLSESVGSVASGLRAGKNYMKQNTNGAFSNRLVGAIDAGNKGSKLKKCQEALETFNQRVQDALGSGLLDERSVTEINRAVARINMVLQNGQEYNNIDINK
jgi:hypothetical protein